MTPTEIHAELKALIEQIGPKAEVYVHLGTGHTAASPISGSIYAYGIGSSMRDGHIHVDADTFEGVIEGLREKWAEHAENHRLNTVRTMALAIIRLTTEHGECTDAALRAEFDAGVVNRWGADACALADEMAGKGPFSIIKLSGANAA